MSITNVLSDDHDVIPYRRKLREITKSVLGTILLQQILHRAKNNKWKPFYKFATPNNHADYAKGDSWTEELGFSEDEFEAARACIASKITSGAKRDSVTVALVYFWTDSNRKTWYEVNRELFETLTNELYDDNSAKGEITLYRKKRKFPSSRKRGNHPLHDSESTESTKIPHSAENDYGQKNSTHTLKDPLQEAQDLAEFNAIPSASKDCPPPMSRAAQEFFAQFGRKRWGTPAERELFEKTENEVGQAKMLDAIQWAASNRISRVPAICTAARKNGNGNHPGNGNGCGKETAAAQLARIVREEINGKPSDNSQDPANILDGVFFTTAK